MRILSSFGIALLMILFISCEQDPVSDELNTADGQLGDGDLGVSMIQGFRDILDILDSLPEDIGMAIYECAKAFTKSSGSSYGTLMATGMMVGYAYAMEFFMAWYSGNEYEGFAFINRAFGPYAWAYWIMVSCNVLSPQIFWFKKARRNIAIIFTASLLVNVGMWFERFVIVVTSLANDFLPSSWGVYEPTWVDVLTFLGSFGLFMTFFLLFIRYLPVLAIAEIKAIMPEADPHHGEDHAEVGGGA